MIRILLTVTLALALSLPTSAAPLPQPPPLPPQLAPWSWAPGNWLCSGDYPSVPGVAAAHHVEATFHIGLSVGGTWLEGHYAEYSSSNGVPAQTVDDYFTVDPFTGAGVRSFMDANPGHFRGGYTFTSAGVDFAGDYNVHGQTVGYHEILTRGPGDASFVTDSRVVLPIGPGGTPVDVTFQTLVCTRLP